jgi:hypothetical protein
VLALIQLLLELADLQVLLVIILRLDLQDQLKVLLMEAALGPLPQAPEVLVVRVVVVLNQLRPQQHPQEEQQLQHHLFKEILEVHLVLVHLFLRQVVEEVLGQMVVAHQQQIIWLEVVMVGILYCLHLRMEHLVHLHQIHNIVILQVVEVDFCRQFLEQHHHQQLQEEQVEEEQVLSVLPIREHLEQQILEVAEVVVLLL